MHVWCAWNLTKKTIKYIKCAAKLDNEEKKSQRIVYWGLLEMANGTSEIEGESFEENIKQ